MGTCRRCSSCNQVLLRSDKGILCDVSFCLLPKGRMLSFATVPATGCSAVRLIRADSCFCFMLWPLLLLVQGIVLFHHSIRGALEVFASEAAALQDQSGVTVSQVAGLVERHRFLRSVCMFHTLSEEEVCIMTLS